VVGDRSRLGSRERDAFERSGTAHLLAVSGLHVAWVFALARAVVGWTLRRSRRRALLRRAHSLAIASAVIASLGYAALTGFGVPALRAVAMAGAGGLAVLGGRPGASANALLAAALLVLALEPGQLFDASFILSFVAVAGILAWSPSGGASGLVHCTLAATLATAPFVAGLGGRLPVATLASNALAVPLVGAAVVPAGLAQGAVGGLWPELGAYTLPLAHALTELSLRAVEALGSADLLHGSARPVQRAALLAAAGFAARALWMRGSAAAWASAAFVGLALLVPGHDSSLSPGESEVLALDVGHGDALLVRDGDAAWLVDAGTQLEGYDVGRAVVAPALRALGVSRIDVLALSHADLDHRGGVTSVLERVAVGELWLTRESWQSPDTRALRAAAAHGGVPLRVVAAGARGPLGGATVRVLWPPGERTATTRNDGSLGLRFDFQRGCALFAGDASAAVERALVREQAPCAFVKLSHHGSRSSTDPVWLDRLQPWLAVASHGRRPRSPLPHASVVERLERARVTLYDTESTGALRVRFTRRGVVAAPELAEPWGRTAGSGRSLH
jgi:competence protein ComEC